jgi:colanic acid biosynthesis glycosyl transferase WcaI
VVEAKIRGRVLVVGINFTPEPIGIGKYTGEFAGSLVREGFDVTVVTAFPHYPWWRVRGVSWRGFSTEASEGLTVVRCPLFVPSKPGGPGRILQDLSFFITSWLAVSWLLLKGRRFDIVYTVVPSFPSAWIGAWVKWFRRSACWVVHVMDLQVDVAEQTGLIRNGWLLRCLAWAERRILRRADIVSTLSQGMLRKILAKGVLPDRAFLFPNWVDLSVYHPGLPDADTLSFLGLPDEGRMVLYSGAIGEKQCLDILPVVAERLRTSLPGVYFVIAGEGPYRERLESLVRDSGPGNIHFIPIQPEPVFRSLLRKAWLHLVLQRDTDSELFLPSKLGPIMATGGCALVTASATSSLGLLLLEHGVGEVVHPVSAEVLHNAILDMDRRPDHVRQLGTRANAYAIRNLERDLVIRRYLSDLGFPVDT